MINETRARNHDKLISKIVISHNGKDIEFNLKNGKIEGLLDPNHRGKKRKIKKSLPCPDLYEEDLLPDLAQENLKFPNFLMFLDKKDPLSQIIPFEMNNAATHQFLHIETNYSEINQI